jgi:hypothetical protein
MDNSSGFGFMKVRAWVRARVRARARRGYGRGCGVDVARRQPRVGGSGVELGG